MISIGQHKRIAAAGVTKYVLRPTRNGVVTCVCSNTALSSARPGKSQLTSSATYTTATRNDAHRSTAIPPIRPSALRRCALWTQREEPEASTPARSSVLRCSDWHTRRSPHHLARCTAHTKSQVYRLPKVHVTELPNHAMSFNLEKREAKQEASLKPKL